MGLTSIISAIFSATFFIGFKSVNVNNLKIKFWVLGYMTFILNNDAGEFGFDLIIGLNASLNVGVNISTYSLSSIYFCKNNLINELFFFFKSIIIWKVKVLNFIN